MKNFARLICSISLLSLLAMAAQAGTLNLKFVDGAGKPIPDVVVRFSYQVIMPLPPAGVTFESKSDAEGNLSASILTCSLGGSCCMFVSPLTYQVVGKFGYNVSGEGTVAVCGPGSSERTIIGSGQEYPKLSVVSAANFREPLSSEMIVAAFGLNLAATTEVAANVPLPTTLSNRRVFFRNSDGLETPAPLLFVSPGQINFLVPLPTQGQQSFPAVIVRDTSNQILNVGFPTVNSFAPGIFTENTDGQGVPAAVIVRARSDGSQQYEPVSQFDQNLKRYVPLALDLGSDSDIVVLALCGTGWRNFGGATVSVKVGGIDCPVEYVGKQPTIEGLDQLNARLPRTLIGKGDVTVEVQFNSIVANPVQLKIK